MLSYIKRHQIILASIVLCLYSLHLVSADRKGRGEAMVKSAIIYVSTPVRIASHAIHDTLTSTWDNYIYLRGLKDENDSLKETIDLLTHKNNNLIEEVMLGQRLKELVKYRKDEPYSTVAATIQGFSSHSVGGDWTRIAVINKGTSHGITRNMAVISPKSIVGRIIETSKSSSTVLLLTDPRSNIDVLIQDTRVKGLIKGKGGDLSLEYVRLIEEVGVGDKLVTLGLSGIFPKGIPVGEVTSVEKGFDNFFKQITVRPTADLEKIEEVLIITRSPSGDWLKKATRGR